MILAEPKALIGFAGPRVIEQTINQELPEGFQRSEFLLQKGMVDRIVHRLEMRRTLSFLLGYFAAASALPQKPRRRAGESLARFRAASVAAPSPMGLSPSPPAVPGAPEPSANGAPADAPSRPAASPRPAASETPIAE